MQEQASNFLEFLGAKHVKNDIFSFNLKRKLAKCGIFQLFKKKQEVTSNFLESRRGPVIASCRDAKLFNHEVYQQKLT